MSVLRGDPCDRSTSEVPESIRAQLRVAYGILNVLVAEVGLQRPGIMTLVRQRETAGVPQHVGWTLISSPASVPVESTSTTCSSRRRVAGQSVRKVAMAALLWGSSPGTSDGPSERGLVAPARDFSWSNAPKSCYCTPPGDARRRQRTNVWLEVTSPARGRKLQRSGDGSATQFLWPPVAGASAAGLLRQARRNTPVSDGTLRRPHSPAAFRMLCRSCPSCHATMRLWRIEPKLNAASVDTHFFECDRCDFATSEDVPRSDAGSGLVG